MFGLNFKKRIEKKNYLNDDAQRYFYSNFIDGKKYEIEFDMSKHARFLFDTSDSDFDEEE